MPEERVKADALRPVVAVGGADRRERGSQRIFALDRDAKRRSRTVGDRLWRVRRRLRRRLLGLPAAR